MLKVDGLLMYDDMVLFFDLLRIVCRCLLIFVNVVFYEIVLKLFDVVCWSGLLRWFVFLCMLSVVRFL